MAERYPVFIGEIFRNGGSKLAVLYSWTEDGLPERCAVSRADSRGGECYYCGGSLDGPCVRLDAPDGDSYLMHCDCAYDGCGAFDRAEIDAAMDGLL